VYFGTHTPLPANARADAGRADSGIFAARFDMRTGQLTGLGSVAAVERPTWIVAHPALPVVYAVSELGNDGRTEGRVSSLRVDLTTGKLQELNSVGAGGGGPTHLALDGALQTLLVANYGTGQVTALPILADGGLAAAVSGRRDYGFGPSPRQMSPHAHAVALDPTGHFVLVADLGADRIFIYRFDAHSRQLTPADPAYEVLPPGSGPRHLLFHRTGRFVIVNTELSAEIRCYRWDPRRGHLQLVQTLSTLAPEFHGPKSTGEIVVSRDGRFVYVSNRGADTIVAYSMNPHTGMLTEVQRIASQGKSPWSFALDPSDHWMLIANEVSGTVTVLQVDPASGQLTPTAEALPVPKPVSVTFLCEQPVRCGAG
jgi:6-phosphogluconolactonase